MLPHKRHLSVDAAQTMTTMYIQRWYTGSQLVSKGRAAEMVRVGLPAEDTDNEWFNCPRETLHILNACLLLYNKNAFCYLKEMELKDGRNPLKMPIGFDPVEWPLLCFGLQPRHRQAVSWTWCREGKTIFRKVEKARGEARKAEGEGEGNVNYASAWCHVKAAEWGSVVFLTTCCVCSRSLHKSGSTRWSCERLWGRAMFQRTVMQFICRTEEKQTRWLLTTHTQTQTYI